MAIDIGRQQTGLGRRGAHDSRARNVNWARVNRSRIVRRRGAIQRVTDGHARRSASNRKRKRRVIKTAVMAELGVRDNSGDAARRIGRARGRSEERRVGKEWRSW